MTEEIKEILDKLKYIVDFSIIEHDTSFNSDNVEENVCLLISNECQLLLDYITNLQQENERLKEDNKSYQEYPFIIIEKNGVICRKNQEIERLNNIINTFEEYLENMKMNLRYSGVKWDNNCLIRAEVIQQVLHKLKELKENDENE